MLRIKKLHVDAVLPGRKSWGAAGYDISSIAECIVIPPGESRLIPTGLAITVPVGTYGRLAPRSGLALTHMISVNGGVIDMDYTGPVGVILVNNDRTNSFTVHKYDRIAQLVIERILLPAIEEVYELEDSDRGVCGFGSTGM